MAREEVMAHVVAGHDDMVAGQTALRQNGYPNALTCVVASWRPEDTVETVARSVVDGWLTSIVPRGQGNHRDNILGYTYGDREGGTVFMGLGAHEGTWYDEDGNSYWGVYVSGIIGDAPGGFVDLYIPDNQNDVGLVPSEGTTYLSEAIKVTTAAGSPRSNPEYGEENHVWVEVHSAGTRAPRGFSVQLWWANPSTNLLEEGNWSTADIHTDGRDDNLINVGSSDLDGTGPWDIGPFYWFPPDPETRVGDDGHFCLLARVDCPEDPVMHPTDRNYENNLAQKNVTVIDCCENGECSCEFNIGGGSLIDVNIDSGQLIQDGGKVYLRIRTRLLQGASNVQGLSVIETTPGEQITTLECSAPNAAIQGIYLAAGRTSQAELRARLPATARDGDLYPVTVSQNVDGRHVGSVTLLARIAGAPAYIGNRNSGELHYANCRWVDRMAPHNKVPFNDLEIAHRRRYDNCAYCLGGSKR
jgi:hypothetical protein